jgi:hypothetical protein
VVVTMLAGCLVVGLAILLIWKTREIPSPTDTSLPKNDPKNGVLRKSGVPRINVPPLLSDLVRLCDWAASADSAQLLLPDSILLWRTLEDNAAAAEILARRVQGEPDKFLLLLIRKLQPARQLSQLLHRIIGVNPSASVRLCSQAELRKMSLFRPFAVAAFSACSVTDPEGSLRQVENLPYDVQSAVFAAIAAKLVESSPALARQPFEKWLGALRPGASAPGSNFTKSFAREILAGGANRHLPKATVFDALYHVGVVDPIAACKWAGANFRAYDPDLPLLLRQALRETSDYAGLQSVLDNELKGLREPLKGEICAAAIGAVAKHSVKDAMSRVNQMPDSPGRDRAIGEFVSGIGSNNAREAMDILNSPADSGTPLRSAVINAIAADDPYKVLELISVGPSEVRDEIVAAFTRKWGEKGAMWLQANGLSAEDLLHSR